MSKTIAVFGAGTGLGAAVARKFGHEGYRVALVARNQARLDDLVTALATDGIEAAAFPADLTFSKEIPGLIGRIRERFGRIDVVEYAPITTDLFTPAAELDSATARHYVDLYLLSLIEVVQAVLPEMVARGDGGILVGQGVSAVRPMPNLSGVGPAMAAARNYIQTLNAELTGTGVYAGVLHIAAVVLGSAGHQAMTAGTLPGGLDLSRVPTVDPADLAALMLEMLTTRNRADVTTPA